MKRIHLPAALLLLVAPCWALAQSSYPMVMGIHPLAAQIGQTTEH